MDVVIYGNGAHGSDIAEDLRARAPWWRRVRIRYMDVNKSRQTWHGESFSAFFVGVNDPSRRRFIATAHGRTHTGSWVHRLAVLGHSVSLGHHTHINAGAFLTRCTLGDFVTVGPNATICGDVTIGDDVMIGAGAVIKNLLTIGDGAVIGCGAVVVEDVPPGVTVVGNPARELVKSC